MQKALSHRNLAFALLIAIAMSILPLAARAAVTGSLSGTVKSTSGTPLAGAHVVIMQGNTPLQSAETDSGGNYTIEGIEPGVYQLRVTLVTFQTTTTSTTITQDVNQRVDFTLNRETHTGGRHITVPVISTSKTSTSTVIGQADEQHEKSQPNNLYQFPGLLFGQPGISYDPSGYVHLRGSDLFQTGFQVDGIDVLNPATQEFGTNIVTVGLKSANYYTNGADASYGNASGGFVNEITENGRDLAAQGIKGRTELTVGPGSQWQYVGTNTAVGDLIDNGKFDYYLTTLRFRNKFPSEGFSVSNLPDSNDNIVKFNYYADPNNTVTAFYGSGLEDYVYSGGNGTNFKDVQPSYNFVDQGAPTDPHEVQSYELGYISAKHSFSPTSFISYRYYQHHSVVDFHEEALNGSFRHETFTNQGHQVDYTNQVNKLYRLQAGVYYMPSVTSYHLISVTGTEPFQTLGADGTPDLPNGYRDRSSLINPTQTVLYLQNQIRPAGDKLTFDLGVRASQQKYSNLKRESDFTDKSTDPRLSAAYAPNRDTNFHTSYSIFSQFPETRYLEYDSPEESGVFPATSLNPAAQNALINAHYQPGKLRPYFSKNFDVGLDKAFNLMDSTYAVSMTGFDKRQFDLPQENLASYSGGSPYPLYYSNDSKGRSSGFEFVLSKKQRRQSDVNGFVSYTNEVTRATSSFFDTGYEPYYAFFVTDPTATASDYTALNKGFYPTSYDQRHTVAVVVTKRISKIIEPSIFLDAGSGFPFAGGGAADPNSLFQVGGADGQHGESAPTGDADFTEAPVVLSNGHVSPFNPVVGRSGWHYKLTLNTNLYVTPDTSLFVNVDNIFDRLTVTTYSTVNQIGTVYYHSPTAAQPQGSQYYGPNNTITPIFLSFGFRHRFR